MNTTYRGTIAVVSPEADLHDVADDGELNNLGAELNRLIESGTTRIIVDLSAVNHINSTALGPLAVSHSKLARRADGRFALAGLNTGITQLLLITKLRSVFEVFKTFGDAVQEFESVP